MRPVIFDGEEFPVRPLPRNVRRSHSEIPICRTLLREIADELWVLSSLNVPMQ
jgi:hypothetical protein